MKDSGVSYIGGIPSDWAVKRLKYVSELQTGTTPSENEGINLDDEGINWFTPGDFSENLLLDLSEKHISVEAVKKFNVKLYPNESILLVAIGATVGKIGYASNTSYSNQQVTALKPFDLESKFLLYYMQSIKQSIKDNALYTTLPIINNGYLSTIQICIPEKNEQKVIAELLDDKTSQLDAIIEKSKASIEKLQAYRKSVIYEAVTKGLDKDILMKDTGVEWIGEIPYEWEVSKIGYSAKLNGRIGWQGLTSEEYKDEGPFLITGTDFDQGKVNFSNAVHIEIKRWLEAKEIQVENGDLLITKDGTVGKVAMIEGLSEKASLNSGVLRIRTNDGINTRYLFWVLNSEMFWLWFNFENSGNSTILHLYQNVFTKFSFTKPNIQQQIKIAEYLDEKIANIDLTLSQIRKKVITTEKLKNSIIYEYVTGKKRVPEYKRGGE